MIALQQSLVVFILDLTLSFAFTVVFHYYLLFSVSFCTTINPIVTL